MKTKEFISKAEELGYEICGTYGGEMIHDNDDRIYLLKNDQNLLYVDMTTSYSYYSGFGIFKKMEHEEKEVLMPVVFEFAATSIELRKEGPL